MPQKDFIIWLNEKTYMQVDFVTVRGNVVSFTVRLMVIESSGEVNLARYDAAHETPNLDVYGRRKGQIRKEWLSGVKPEKVRLQRSWTSSKTMKNMSLSSSATKPQTTGIAQGPLKSMRETEVIRWLKSEGAVPTPPEIKQRLMKAGHSGTPEER